MFLMTKLVCRVSSKVQPRKLSSEQQGAKFKHGSENDVKDQNTRQQHPVWALAEKCPAPPNTSEFCPIFCDCHLPFCTSSGGQPSHVAVNSTAGPRSLIHSSFLSYKILLYLILGQTAMVLSPGEPSSPVFIQIQVVHG